LENVRLKAELQTKAPPPLRSAGRTLNISSIPPLLFAASFLLLLYAEMSDVRKAD
jgi:hypothetical protein